MKLGIVLSELLTNCYKHGKEKEKVLLIKVYCYSKDGQISLIVKDNGLAKLASSYVKGMGTVLSNQFLKELGGNIKTTHSEGHETKINAPLN